MKWEVGKAYKIKNQPTIVKCIFVSDRGSAMLRRKDFVEYSASPGIVDFYEEYKEPMKGKVWVSIYRDPAGKLYSISDAQKPVMEQSFRNLLAKVEIPWTEGDGL